MHGDEPFGLCREFDLISEFFFLLLLEFDKGGGGTGVMSGCGQEKLQGKFPVQFRKPV